MKHPVNDALVVEYIKRLRSGEKFEPVFPLPLSEYDFTDEQKAAIKEARKARKKLTKKSKSPSSNPPQSQPITPKPTVPPLPKAKPAAPKAGAPVKKQTSKPQSLDMLEKLLFPATTKPVMSKPVTPPTKPVVPKPAVAIGPEAAAPKPTAPPPALAPKPQSFSKLEKMFFLQQERCFFCGEKMTLAEANIEHLNPVSLGGNNHPDNLVVCHKTLNETFGNLPLKQKFEFVLKAAGSFRCPKK